MALSTPMRTRSAQAATLWFETVSMPGAVELASETARAQPGAQRAGAEARHVEAVGEQRQDRHARPARGPAQHFADGRAQQDDGPGRTRSRSWVIFAGPSP